ncbi:MAG: hypothetical protein WDN72_04045 [Alphaproteobacteria bacterium]
MASTSNPRLHAAFAAVELACESLETATSRLAAQRSGAEAEVTASWQAHSEKLEASVADLTSENDFLKEDNLRLSNQLARLQKDYLALQEAASGTLLALDESVKQIDLILEH